MPQKRDKEKARLYSIFWREKNADRMTELRKNWAAKRYKFVKDNGICANCQRVQAAFGKVLCGDCQKVLTAQARKRKYGVTHERFLEMLDAQDRRCAICDVAIGHGAHIDHDHTTKQVRGLLCGHCNRGIGTFRDSSDVVMKAAAYLKRYGL